MEAWRKDFGETLSFEAAKAETTRLVDFFVAMQDILTVHRPEEDIAGAVATAPDPLKRAWLKRTPRW